MPDPVASASSSSSGVVTPIDIPEAEACRISLDLQQNECSASQDTPNGSSLLTAKFDSKDYSAFIRNQSDAAPPPSTAPSKDVVGGSATTFSTSGIQGRGIYASVRRDQQFDVQAGAVHADARGAQSGFQISSSVDVGTLRANFGGENDDGTTGFNAGIMATAIGGEATVESGGWSATVGLSVSQGVFLSSGEGRDIDGDGAPERCFKGSIGPFTLGVCTEL